jgi:hypothetical protein
VGACIVVGAHLMGLSIKNGRVVREVMVDHGRERVIVPREATERCRRYVKRLLRALPRQSVLDGGADREDRAAALAICLFSEIACIEDPVEREQFLQATLNAHEEIVGRTVAANEMRLKAGETHARDARAKV